MNRDLYSKNLAVLKKNHLDIAETIEKKEYKLIEDISVFSEKAITGEIVFKVNSLKRDLFIDGKYNPAATLEKWLVEQKKFENESIIIIIGFGNTSQLKRLLNITKDGVKIIVYEPCINIFLKAMEEIELSDVLSDSRIIYVIEGINGDKLKRVLDIYINFDNLNIMHHLILGNYANLFSDKVKEFVEIYRKRLEIIERSNGTVLNFSDVNGINILNNFKYIYDNYTTFQLKNFLSQNIPSIIVAAGPSLNKNILDLKKAKGKACIIATDTALKPLLNNGIVPDFMVIVDGKKQAVLFEHEGLSQIPMVMSSVASSEAVSMHKGKKFLSWDGTKYESELIKIAREYSENPERMDLISIPTGGSVATTAFSLASIMGSETIILVGQDLALTGNKTHADGTFEDKMTELDMKVGNYLEVEDIYGNPVLTRPDYKSYLDWFNEKIPQFEHLKVIDATEGGAKITGTEIITLKEAIDRECKESIDIESMLNKLEPIFKEEKVKEQAKIYFNNTVDRFEDVREKLGRGIDYYEKIIKLCEKPNLNIKEYLKISKKVSNINDFLNDDGIALLIIDSIRNLDFSLRAVVYNTEDNEQDERINIAKHGKVYLKAMLERIDPLKEFAKDTVGKVGYQEGIENV